MDVLNVQGSSVQFSSVQFSSVQFSSVQFSSVQFSSVQFSFVQFSSVQFSSRRQALRSASPLVARVSTVHAPCLAMAWHGVACFLVSCHVLSPPLSSYVYGNHAHGCPYIHTYVHTHAGITYEAWGVMKNCQFNDTTITRIARTHNATAASPLKSLDLGVAPHVLYGI